MSGKGLGFQRGAPGGFIALEVVWFVGSPATEVEMQRRRCTECGRES
jgi:hypothetical protein